MDTESEVLVLSSSDDEDKTPATVKKKPQAPPIAFIPPHSSDDEPLERVDISKAPGSKKATTARSLTGTHYYIK
jgi:hypothetical protein